MDIFINVCKYSILCIASVDASAFKDYTPIDKSNTYPNNWLILGCHFSEWRPGAEQGLSIKFYSCLIQYTQYKVKPAMNILYSSINNEINRKHFQNLMWCYIIYQTFLKTLYLLFFFFFMPNITRKDYF